MKFLHTADWQVGMVAAHVGKAAERVREQRLKSAAKVIELARTQRADFVLVAGDTFENNGVKRLLVQQIVDILAGFGGPVYVLPGNHDPLEPGSVWDYPGWRSCESIHVVRKAEAIPLPGGVLLASPAFEKHSDRNPTAWMEQDSSQGVRIGMAHGSVEGVSREEMEYPIPREAPMRARLDYLALGHWHSYAAYPQDGASARMAYSGTHETTKFGERDSGNAVMVELSAPGAPPRLTAHATGELLWEVLECSVQQPGDLARLREQVEKRPAPERTLLDLRLKGAFYCHEHGELEHLRNLLESRFLFGRLSAGQLQPVADMDSWVVSLPEGAVRMAAAQLLQLANPQYAAARAPEATPEAAMLALLELYGLQGGIQP